MIAWPPLTTAIWLKGLLVSPTVPVWASKNVGTAGVGAYSKFVGGRQESKPSQSFMEVRRLRPVPGLTVYPSLYERLFDCYVSPILAGAWMTTLVRRLRVMNPTEPVHMARVSGLAIPSSSYLKRTLRFGAATVVELQQP